MDENQATVVAAIIAVSAITDAIAFYCYQTEDSIHPEYDGLEARMQNIANQNDNATRNHATVSDQNDKDTLSDEQKRQIIAKAIFTKVFMESTDVSSRETYTIRSVFRSKSDKQTSNIEDEKSEGLRHVLDSFRSAIRRDNRSVVISEEIHKLDDDIEMQNVREIMTKDNICTHVNDNINNKRRFESNLVDQKLSRSLRKQGSDLETMECNICLMDFEIGEETGWSRNPNCVHGFHKECIVDWLSEKNECPICRRDYLYQSKENNLDITVIGNV